jgi:hypothetical protein
MPSKTPGARRGVSGIVVVESDYVGSNQTFVGHVHPVNNVNSALHDVPRRPRLWARLQRHDFRSRWCIGRDHLEAPTDGWVIVSSGRNMQQFQRTSYQGSAAVFGEHTKKSGGDLANRALALIDCRWPNGRGRPISHQTAGSSIVFCARLQPDLATKARGTPAAPAPRSPQFGCRARTGSLFLCRSTFGRY